jgi:hypothetical protein
MNPVIIEAVPADSRAWALEHLALAADGRNPPRPSYLRELLAGFEQASRPRPQCVWVRRGERPRAAAAAVPTCGRTAYLLAGPAPLRPADRTALAAAVRAACLAVCRDGAHFVQRFVPDARDGEVPLLREAGFEPLAELQYLRKDLTAEHQPAPGRRDVSFWGLGGGHEQDLAPLAEIIPKTYEGSLDCPQLSGVRPIEDVLASHKAIGIYQPRSWWIADLDRQPAACLLANRSLDATAWEIVYLGVVPRFRGCGLARTLLEYAASQAQLDGVLELRLAVDARNHFACNVYEEFGLQKMYSRSAWWFRPPPAAGERGIHPL